MLPTPKFLLEPAGPSFVAPPPIQPNRPYGRRNFRGRGPNRNFDQRPRNKNMIQCDYDGCRFQSESQDEMVMHKKINHFQLCSRYNEEFLSDSPEEIAKWRAERRKKFPRASDLDSDKNDKPPEYRKSFGNDSRNRPPRRFPQGRGNRDYNRGNRFPNKKFCPPNYPVRESKITSPKNQVAECQKNSLNLLSCYGADTSEEELDLSPKKNPPNHDGPIISQWLNELITKIDKNQIISKKSNPIVKRKKPYNPNLNLPYSKLSMFQKLMLQDVRQAKNNLLKCLSLIRDSNYLEQT